MRYIRLGRLWIRKGRIKMGNEICELCFHKEACMHLIDARNEELVGCIYFVNKDKVLVLPVAIGSKVWCIGQPCGGCPCFNEPMTEQFIEECRNCKQYEIAECSFDYELIPEFNEFVFATKNEAEVKWKELTEFKGGDKQ